MLSDVVGSTLVPVLVYIHNNSGRCMFAVLLLFFFSSIQSLSSFVYLLYYVSVCMCNNIDKKWKRGGGRLPCFAYDYILYSIYVVVVVDVECPSSTYIGGGTQVSGYCFPH